MMKTIYYASLVLLIILVSTNRVSSCPSICSCRTTNNTVIVECLSGGLTVIPTDFPSDSCRIKITDNNITTIEERAFQNMTLLFEIYLSGNQINTIQQGTFIDLPALEYIYLSGNRITILQQGTFEDLPALVYIEIDNSRINTIQNGVFKNLPALKVLYIRGNMITSLQQGTFEDLPALEKIALDSNEIGALQTGAFKDLSALNEVRLVNNQITTIHTGAFENLRVLNSFSLSDQNITTIYSGAFKDLPGLVSIVINGNPITTIHEGAFADLPALESIECDGTTSRITTIQSGAFRELSALKYIKLQGNTITILQQGTFKDLPALKTIWFDTGTITTIQRGPFKNLTALDSVFIRGNKITTIQQGTFEDLPALRNIGLHSNEITTIHTGAFKDLPMLDHLGLNNSKITTIHSGAFENLRVLKSLYLSDQNITTVHSGAFKDLPGLISLYLSSNRITIIQQGTFEDLPALGYLELDGNRITVIQSGAFKDLPALKNLYLRGNTLTTIQQGTFKDLPALFIIQLDSSNITTIQSGAFENLTALHSLFIRGNRINVIQQGTFEDLPALQTMYVALNSNIVTTIQTGAFKDLPALNNIDLSGSNLKFARNDTFAYITNLHSLHLGLFCDCNVPFWSWLKTKSFTNENVYCLDRNHVQLSSLNASDFDNCTYNACQYTDYCSNGGSCSQNSFGDLSCSCVVEWTGATCTESANHCVANVDNFHTNWRKTAESTLATLECTGEYTGNASRYCSSDGKWQEPNYSNCTSNSIEHIKEQTAKLLSGDNKTDPVTIILNDLENITRDNDELRSGDLLTSSTVLNDIAKYVTNHTENLSVDQLEIFGSLCDNLLDERNHQSWKELNNEGLGGVTSLVNAVTEYSNAFNGVIDSELSLVVAKENVVMQVGKASSDEITVPDRLKTSDSWISDSATEIKLKKNICSGLTGYSSTFYRNISRFFPKYIILNGNIKPFNGSYGVNSIIADFTIHGTTCSDYSLIIKFEHLLENYSKPFCGHWDFSASNTVNGAWSTYGSQVVDATDYYTICEYNHTTNFAILMSPGRTPSSHHIPLSLISAIGCGVSILFLVITILIHFVLWRYVKTDRTKTLMNLCVALVMSYVIFLAGIKQTENKVVCSAIAIALHYIFLTDFALMLAEGILIVRMVVFVFPASSIIHKLIPACWIVPAVIVGITAAVTKLKGYGNQQFCWLTLESNLIWAFIGPALLVIVINFMFIIITVYKMMTTRGLAAKTLKVKFKIGLKSICVILPLFGLTWVLGAFSINDDLVMFQYLFATFNSLQYIRHLLVYHSVKLVLKNFKTKYVLNEVWSWHGFFICLFHCILNEQVRLGYRHYQRRRHAYRMDSKLPTESTNTDNSKTHRLNDNFREKKKQMKEN